MALGVELWPFSQTESKGEGSGGQRMTDSCVSRLAALGTGGASPAVCNRRLGAPS